MKKDFARTAIKAAIIALLLSAPALPVVAAPLLANIMASPSQFSIAPNVQYRAVQVRVTGPNGFKVTSTFLAGQNPSVLLPGHNGLYKYELSFSPVVDPATQAAMANARQRGVEPAANPAAASTVQSGSFRIANGSLLSNAAEAPMAASSSRSTILSAPKTTAAATAPGVSVPLDQVIADDLIVQGSACIGQDCINGETFGFDTLILKENNLRILFKDTSNTASFPNVNWELVANDTTNGGLNKFSIADVTNSKTPFTIEANAPTNSLYVDDGGRIGVGTSTPVVEIHAVDGNSPTLRLEQNGSQGFTAQTWDVAGNEANFFVRDVTNGSRLPFRIKPGAPSSSVMIDATGKVGIGKEFPDSRLHVKGTSDAETTVHIQATGNNDAIIRLNQQGVVPKVWDIRGNNATGRLTISDDAARVPMKFGPGAIDNLFRVGIVDTSTVDIAGNLIVNGTFSNPSSRELKNLLAGSDVRSVLAKIASLPLFTWSYKNDDRVRHFGPVAEDFYERFSLGLDAKHISPNDLAGVALAAAQALNSLRMEKDAQIDALLVEKDAQIGEMKARLARLERLLGQQAAETSTGQPKAQRR